MNLEPTRRDGSGRGIPRRLPWVVLAVVVVVAGAVIVFVAVGGDEGEPRATAETAARPTSTTFAPTTLQTTTTEQVTTTTAATTSSTTSSTTTVPAKPPYSNEDLDYFAQVAGSSEFGGGRGVLHRWENDLLIEVRGAPELGDVNSLERVVSDLNEILEDVEVRLVDGPGNVVVHFGPHQEFAAVEPNYVSGNLGFFWVWWDGGGEITSSHVLISTTDTDPASRAHLIREELTQCLGLLNDSWDYEESTFYQGWTTTQAYAPIDVTVIEMLYRPELMAGMGVAEALELLAGLPAG